MSICRNYSAFFFLVISAVAQAAPIQSAPVASKVDVCGSGWVYFDIGNTLVNTSDGDHLKYMPEALAYLRALTAAGFHLGLISNVPDTWGPSVEAKLIVLKQNFAQSWSDSEPFDWSTFESVLLPPSDAQRKPNPFLFNQARTLKPDCKIAFESEDPIETRAALAAGFNQAFTTGKAETGLFLPIEQLFPDFIRRNGRQTSARLFE